jgi:hypothetical protein
MDSYRTSSFPNALAVSSQATPTYEDKSINLQSESLAWLNNAAENSTKHESILEISSNTQVDDFHPIEENTAYKLVNETNKNFDYSNGLINVNGKF